MAQRSNFIVRGGADFSQLNKALNQTQVKISAFQGAVSKSMKLISVALSSIAVGKIAKESTQAAMAVESAMDNIQRNMGASASAFAKFVDTQSKSLAMAKKDAYTYGSVFSNLLASFVGGTEQVANETQKLMQAAAVIASKTGRTYEDVANRIRSGLLGSTEAIEDLGVYTNISMIESTEAFKKFANGKSWNQLTFQIQQQIRLAAILEQAYKRYGDTLADTTATKQAQFLASLQNIKLNLGQAFLPIYNTILPALTALAERIENITAHIAAFTQALFGKATVTNVKGIEQQTEAITEQGNAIEKAGKQAKGAKAPFDEINEVAQAKDTTSIISTPSIDSTKPVINTEIIESSDNFAKSIEDLKEKLQPTVKALKNLSKALEPVKEFTYDSIKSFYNDVLAPIGEWVLSDDGIPKLLNSASNLLNNVDWAKLTESIKDFNKAIAPLAVEVGKGFIDFVSDLTENLSPVVAEVVSALSDALDKISDALDDIDPQVAHDVGYSLGMIFTILGSVKIIDKLPGWISDVGAGLATFFSGLQGFMTVDPTTLAFIFGPLIEVLDQFIWNLLPEWAKNAYNAIWDAILYIFKRTFSFDYAKQLWEDTANTFKKAFADGTPWYEIGWNIILGILKGIWAAAGTIIEPIVNFFNLLWETFCNIFGISSPAKKMEPIGEYILLGIIQGFKNAFSKFWEAIASWGKTTRDKFGTWAGNIWGAVKGGFSSTTTWFGNTFTSAFNKIKEVFSVTAARNHFANVWSNIKSCFGHVADWFKDTFSAAWKNVKDVFSTGGKIFSGIKEGIENTFKTVVNKIIDGINVIIEKPFNAINGMLNKIRNVSVMGLEPFKNFWSENPLKVPQIPKLATGTVVPKNNGEFMAILGDNRYEPEIVSPLSIIKQAIREEMQTRDAMGETAMLHVTLTLPGGKVLLDTIVEANREYISRYGKSPLVPA